jgi:predicted Na+-dependent transporter
MELLHAIQKASLLSFLICSMGGIGMRLEPRALLAPLRSYAFVIIALVLNFVLAPALAWAITAVLPLEPGHATGLLLLGVAAGAPFLPKLAEISRESVTLATAAMVLLTVGTVLFMPLVLPWMIPGFHADPWVIAQPMVMLLLLPLGIGMMAKAGLPRMAAVLGPIFARVGSVSLLLLFVLLVVLNVSGLLAVIGTGAIAASMLHTAGLFFIAWMVLRVWPECRGMQSLCVSARNFGAAMVPAAGTLVDPDIMIMIVTSAVVGLLVCSLEAVWVRRRRSGSLSGADGTLSM